MKKFLSVLSSIIMILICVTFIIFGFIKADEAEKALSMAKEQESIAIENAAKARALQADNEEIMEKYLECRDAQ